MRALLPRAARSVLAAAAAVAVAAAPACGPREPSAAPADAPPADSRPPLAALREADGWRLSWDEPASSAHVAVVSDGRGGAVLEIPLRREDPVVPFSEIAAARLEEPLWVHVAAVGEAGPPRRTRRILLPAPGEETP